MNTATHHHVNGSTSSQADYLERDIESTRDHLGQLMSELSARLRGAMEWKDIVRHHAPTAGFVAATLLVLLLFRSRRRSKTHRRVLVFDGDTIRIARIGD